MLYSDTMGRSDHVDQDLPNTILRYVGCCIIGVLECFYQSKRDYLEHGLIVHNNQSDGQILCSTEEHCRQLDEAIVHTA
jgi:hypothetical protein